MDNLKFSTDGTERVSASMFSTGTVYFNHWGEPVRVSVIEKTDCIEMIYKQTSLIWNTIYPQTPPDERVYKIVFSCKDGKWHKSEPIYGKIQRATPEWYDFTEPAE